MERLQNATSNSEPSAIASQKPQPVYPVGQENCSGSWAVDEVYETAAKVVHPSATCDRSPTLQPLVGRLSIDSNAGTLKF